jgi:hypothetical protein
LKAQKESAALYANPWTGTRRSGMLLGCATSGCLPRAFNSRVDHFRAFRLVCEICVDLNPAFFLLAFTASSAPRRLRRCSSMQCCVCRMLFVVMTFQYLSTPLLFTVHKLCRSSYAHRISLSWLEWYASSSPCEHGRSTHLSGFMTLFLCFYTMTARSHR